MRAILFFTTAILTISATAQPLVDSWFTERSGAYAKAYPDNAAEVAGTPSTTWPHPNGGISQSIPTYAGVHEIASTNEHVYIRSSGLGFHIMGPWYNNVGQTSPTPSFPENQALLYRFDKTPEAATSGNWDETSLGAVGYFVDGVSIFDSRDAFGYVNATNSETSLNASDQKWSRDAYVNEFLAFDSSNSHQAGGHYHSHANPLGLRHQLNDSVTYHESSNTYTETPNGKHSPIIGWLNDGYPLYGPYGYSDPNDTGSAVERMVTGYQPRPLSSGAARDTLPQWCNDLLGKTLALTADQYGPAIDAPVGARDVAELGRYIEDHDYKGDLAMTQGTDFDLDRHNGRWCKTPEFPDGTYAYFVTIDELGTPLYPYAVGPVFYGKAKATKVSQIPLEATTHFKGGPAIGAKDANLEFETDDLTLTWSSTEGGRYQVEKSTNLNDWEPVTTVTSQAESAQFINSKGTNAQEFYRITQTTLPEFDVKGFDFRAAADVPEVAKPNILLIILDDWGVDSSPWDNPSADRNATMQNIDGLVRNGLRFSNAYAQAACSPTRASILTGTIPAEHGIGVPGNTLADNLMTLPRLFDTAGSDYALASYGKWHLGGDNDGPFLIGGWPEFYGFSGGGSDYNSWTPINNGTRESTLSSYITTDLATKTADFIQAQDALDKPWFCWLAFNAPHSPFHEPPASLLQSNWDVSATTDRDLYEKMLEAVDTEIGNVLAHVDLTETTVIVLGDNGTPGILALPPYTNGHAKGSLYDGGGHVPMVIAGANVKSRGVTKRIVHCADLYSTIAEIAGIDAFVPIETRDTSESFFEELAQESPENDKIVIVERFGTSIIPGRALRSGDYRLLIYDDPSTTADTPTYEAYHVTLDETETDNLLTKPLSDKARKALSLMTAESNRLDGGFDFIDFSNHAVIELYIELPSSGVQPSVPRLYNNNGNIVAPEKITIGNIEASYVTRSTPSGQPDQHWIKAYLDPSLLTAGTHTITVEFSDAPSSGLPRVYTALNNYVKP